VHSNVNGPILTHGGAKYFVFFIDKFTRKKPFCIFHHKSHKCLRNSRTSRNSRHLWRKGQVVISKYFGLTTAVSIHQALSTIFANTLSMYPILRSWMKLQNAKTKNLLKVRCICFNMRGFLMYFGLRPSTVQFMCSIEFLHQIWKTRLSKKHGRVRSPLFNTVKFLDVMHMLMFLMRKMHQIWFKC